MNDGIHEPGEHLKNDTDAAKVPESTNDQESLSGEGLTIAGMRGGLPGDIDKLEDETPEEQYRKRGAP